MLLCQQEPAIDSNDAVGKTIDSIFLTPLQLAAYMTNATDGTILIIDCGSPLRHTERRIQDSFLLNVNDKISRKRLINRGLTNFLNTHQLDRLDKSKTIILYDDSVRSSLLCANSSIQRQLSPAMKCVHDEIKRYDTNKVIYVLQSSFDEFCQQCSSLCYVSTSTNENQLFPLSVTPKSTHIEFHEISKILPGLYLGSLRDAESLDILQKHHIKIIINISTSIPCYFEDDKRFEYLQLSCCDSSNQNILQYFETTFKYIHQQLSMKKNILVHCQGGVSRSPSFIIGYLMRYHSKTFDEAYKLVKDKRTIINPNLNFLGQLTQYERMLTSA